MSRRPARSLFGILPAALATACATASEPNVEPEGREVTGTTATLEAGANLIQRDSPVDRMGVYLVGFHPMKEDPAHQMEAHHYCNQVNEDFAQCALFDGNTKDANLNGIEYIISERIFQNLPEAEKRYWHPHNYEILSGQLVAPGLPDAAEKGLMRQKMNSYGKTWHLWNTGNTVDQEGDTLPLGEPMLAWSFNRDGEAAPGLVESRDREMGIDAAEKRKSREDLAPLAKPQEGVDSLLGAFQRPTMPLPGVEDAEPGAHVH
jgi:hypothetical protein